MLFFHFFFVIVPHYRRHLPGKGVFYFSNGTVRELYYITRTVYTNRM